MALFMEPQFGVDWIQQRQSSEGHIMGGGLRHIGSSMVVGILSLALLFAITGDSNAQESGE